MKYKTIIDNLPTMENLNKFKTGMEQEFVNGNTQAKYDIMGFAVHNHKFYTLVKYNGKAI